MRYSAKLLMLLMILAVAAPPLLFAQETIPRFTTVDPSSGKSGDVITVTGENCGKALIAELYLTDGKNDTKVVMSEQADTSIKFKLPAGVKPGSYKLMILTKGKEPKLIEQPVRVTVE
jgi:hypothetical protein